MWLAILVVMIWAGFWQLGRAEQKKLINQRLSSDSLSHPKSLTDWQTIAAFETITVMGTFDNTHLLLDNQIMDGHVGYFVFTAFQTVDGMWLLINRGWTADKEQDFELPSTQTTLKALAADWPSPGIQLGEQVVENKAVQHLTYLEQEATTTMLKARLCKQNNADGCIILPRVVKLDPEMAYGFKRAWQLPRMTVEKHRAYAAQWFTMSLVLCIIYAIFLRKIYASKN